MPGKLLTKELEQKLEQSYDEIPYDSNPFLLSHPDRLATIGTLFGMKPQPASNCRVLEIGCAGGGNLVPMAHSLPDSQFVGIDLSKNQIAAGQLTVNALGLKNVELKHLNIMDAAEELGKFDYIIAHGVYSWVSDAAQNKILEICRDHLTEQGIAYISYNTYPGWHFRGMIRDMMMYHAGHLKDASMRAQQARALLDFLAQSVPMQDNAYGIMLKNELDMLRQQQDNYLLHDHLEEANDPVYFYEFMDRSTDKGLQYLGESEFSTMLTSNFPKEVNDTLRRISNEIVRTEQYMDFVRNRTFRQTLLCRKEVVLDRNLTPDVVMSLCIASRAKAVNENIEINSNKSETFALPSGITLSTGHPLVKAAFVHLANVWPQAVPFHELVTKARASLANIVFADQATMERDAQVLAADILNVYTTGLVVLRKERANFVTEVTDKPEASAVARYQAQKQNRVTNELHESMFVDVFIQQLLMLLDGTRDHDQILSALVELVKKGTLVVQKDGSLLSEGDELRDILVSTMNEALATMSKTALLVR